MGKKKFPPKEAQAIVEICNNDPELALFVLTWLKNGMNARKAYQELHPKVDPKSAAVLGYRQLIKVNKSDIAALYGLDIDKYMTQLKEGVEAMRQISATIIYTSGKETDANEKTTDFIEVPDHKVRLPYHTKLGIILGVERDQLGSATQVNITFPSWSNDNP